ncbi:MAG TPA: hypothetical protein ENN32_03620 [Chloroflexi bacterium]|nr:hypothetical protein [Chloroflexota bacterium]
MSEFIRLLNQIKTHRNRAWLTPSQVNAMRALQKTLRIPGTVNLFGSVGVGKTFLGWSLAEEMRYVYLAHIDCLADLQDQEIIGLIVDNCAPDRESHRNILKHLSFRKIRYAVLITQQMIGDYTSYVELELEAQDWDRVVENLKSIKVFRDPSSASNLWQLLNPYLSQGV